MPARYAFFRYNARQKEAADTAIARVGLMGYENRGVGQLSGGQLKRAMIARVLASDTDVIALDEPDASLDADAAHGLFTMLRALKTDKTIIVASHNLSDILGIAGSCRIH